MCGICIGQSGITQVAQQPGVALSTTRRERRGARRNELRPWDLLLPYVAWLGNTPFAMWLGGAPWRVAALLTMHLFGITTLLGTVILASLRLLGVFQPQKPIAQLHRDLQPVRRLGFTLTFVAGALVFAGGAVSYYEGYWFRLKIGLLFVALVFHVTVYRTVVNRDRQESAVISRLTGVAMLLLWFSVGWAGRAIAFF